MENTIKDLPEDELTKSKYLDFDIFKHIDEVGIIEFHPDKAHETGALSMKNMLSKKYEHIEDKKIYITCYSSKDYPNMVGLAGRIVKPDGTYIDDDEYRFIRVGEKFLDKN